jgi:hypothetical protein
MALASNAKLTFEVMTKLLRPLDQEQRQVTLSLHHRSTAHSASFLNLITNLILFIVIDSSCMHSKYGIAQIIVTMEEVH